jgi:hypothetical protein
MYSTLRLTELFAATETPSGCRPIDRLPECVSLSGTIVEGIAATSASTANG